MKSWRAKTSSDLESSTGWSVTGRISRVARSWLDKERLRALARRHVGDLCLGLGAAAYLAWVLMWQYTRFVEGRFSFHDLALITDFFSNALYHGQPFWITDYELFHFKIHFTPTLFLLIPFFLLFKSQFALIAIVATTVALGLFVAGREQHSSLQRAGVPVVYRFLLTASFFLLLAFNRYTLRCMNSAHFEPVFILPAMLVLAAVRRGESYGRTLALCLLALGVRQDAGLFLFFLMLACFFAPASWDAMRRSRVAAAALLSVLYVVFATKVALPWFGSDTATRMWQRWGETWPDVFVSWTEQPEAVYEAVGRSEFIAWNAEFTFLHAVHGVAWVLTQLPGILFYTADAWDKQRLAYYNTSFLLPGVALCLQFAQLHGAAFIERMTRQRRVPRHIGYALVTGVFLYVSLNLAFFAPRENEDTLQVGELKRTDVFVKPELRRLLRCKEIKSVATDFDSIVFVPMRLERYLPRNALKADVAVVRRQGQNKRKPFYVAPEALRGQLLKDGAFRSAFTLDDYEIFVASRIDCSQGGNPR